MISCDRATHTHTHTHTQPHTHTHTHPTHTHTHTHTGFLRQIGQPDILYKPVQSVKGNRELNFYENIYSCDDPSLTSDIRTLKQLIPKFFGHEEICDHYGDVCKCTKFYVFPPVPACPHYI